MKRQIIACTLIIGGGASVSLGGISAAYAADGCHKLVARVALRNDQGFLNIPVSVNGHAVSMIVDTGSEGSLISPEAASLFAAQRDKSVHTVVRGTGGLGGLYPMRS